MQKPANDLASRLNIRVAIQQEVQTDDGAGGFTSTWQAVATVWAEIRPWSIGRNDEIFRSMQIEDRNFYRITIRYMSGVSAKMRVVFGSRLFNIITVVDPDARQDSLELYVAEGVAL